MDGASRKGRHETDADKNDASKEETDSFERVLV